MAFMKMTILSIALCASLFLSFLVQAQDSDPKTIYWTRWDAPPVFLLDGPYKDQGVQDLVELALRKRLKNYKHKVIRANVLRVIKLAEDKANTCNAGWLDTPYWRKMFYFSTPTMVTPSNGIIIKTKNLGKLTNIKPLSLQKVLDKTQLQLGLGKLYGEGIDDILKKNEGKYADKIHRVANPINTYKMLLADRLDYTIGYPVEAYYYQMILKGKEKFTHVPLVDNAPFVEVVAACSNTPWGKKVIDEINVILKDPKIHKEIDGYLNRWQDGSLKERLVEPRKQFYQKLGLPLEQLGV